MSADDAHLAVDHTTVAEEQQAEAVSDDAGTDAAQTSLKRKADEPAELASEGSPKRAKIEDDETGSGRAATPTEADVATRADQDTKRDSGDESSSWTLPKTEPAESRKSQELPTASTASPDRRREHAQEERKRNKRLFGGLLTTLSHSTTNNTQQQRRQEIERKQRDRAKAQRIEDDLRRAARLTKLNQVRKVEQVTFDEQVMHSRHAAMTAQAHFLQTASRPKLFYRPWELTEEQDQVIKDQVRDAERTIERETWAWQSKKKQALKDLGVVEKATELTKAGELKDLSSHPIQARNSSEQPARPFTTDKDHEERDIMVETEEDTVIY